MNPKINIYGIDAQRILARTKNRERYKNPFPVFAVILL